MSLKETFTLSCQNIFQRANVWYVEHKHMATSIWLDDKVCKYVTNQVLPKQKVKGYTETNVKCEIILVLVTFYNFWAESSNMPFFVFLYTVKNILQSCK